MVFSVPQSLVSKMKLIALLSSGFWGGLRQQVLEMFFSTLTWETAIRGKSVCKKEERKGKILVGSQTLGANVGVNQRWICPDGNCSFYRII